MRQARIYGVRPTRTFEQAAAKFVLENQHKRTLYSDVGRLKQLMPRIGQVPLDKLHRGTLQPWIEARHRQGVAVGTINHDLKVVRRILNLAAGEWMDENGLTWAAAQGQAPARYPEAATLSAQLGGAGALVQGAASPSRRDGALCREHGLP
jgi:hypothetical protein